MARNDTQQTNFRIINHFMARNGDVMTRQVHRQLQRLKDKAIGAHGARRGRKMTYEKVSQ